MRSTKGVTLLELIVALALIGIVSAFTLPGLQGIFERNNFNNTKDDIVQLLTDARNHALANDQEGASGGTDCSWTGTPGSGYQVYFAFYKFYAEGNHYDVQETWKKYNNSGSLCHEMFGADGFTPKEVSYVPVSKTLPSTMHFDFGSGTYLDVKYSTSSSQVTLDPYPYQLKLIDDKLPTDNTYYICIAASGLPRAQKTSCP